MNLEVHNSAHKTLLSTGVGTISSHSPMDVCSQQTPGGKSLGHTHGLRISSTWSDFRYKRGSQGPR